MQLAPIYIGIDPGVTGAIAVFHGLRLTLIDIPTLTVRRGRTDKKRVDVAAVCRIAFSYCELASPPARVVLEDVGGIMGQSASAAFAFGRTQGNLEAAFIAAGAVVSYVPPPVWRKSLNVRPGKDGSRARAIQLFPESAHLFARVKDDGRAEAALIGEHGRRVGL